jgi:hypothetical protein
LTVFFAPEATADGVDGVGDMMEKIEEAVEAVEELFDKVDRDVDRGRGWDVDKAIM